MAKDTAQQYSGDGRYKDESGNRLGHGEYLTPRTDELDRQRETIRQEEAAAQALVNEARLNTEHARGDAAKARAAQEAQEARDAKQAVAVSAIEGERRRDYENWWRGALDKRDGHEAEIALRQGKASGGDKSTGPNPSAVAQLHRFSAIRKELREMLGLGFDWKLENGTLYSQNLSKKDIEWAEKTVNRLLRDEAGQPLHEGIDSIKREGLVLSMPLEHGELLVAQPEFTGRANTIRKEERLAYAERSLTDEQRLATRVKTLPPQMWELTHENWHIHKNGGIELRSNTLTDSDQNRLKAMINNLLVGEDGNPLLPDQPLCTNKDGRLHLSLEQADAMFSQPDYRARKAKALETFSPDNWTRQTTTRKIEGAKVLGSVIAAISDGLEWKAEWKADDKGFTIKDVSHAQREELEALLKQRDITPKAVQTGNSSWRLSVPKAEVERVRNEGGWERK